ncbi:hypothetical protein Q4F19_16190 [Sphingomonas sp. BIUV-7]|uniref:Uncharacterized protein n=1 Tax=Sphingomonas natans TaxID=3063330 RepID=A0ABT8YC78_9SPHN|nr:hypothetical protein [Sphingomonas sp. BIUV-7]MDO6415931.1 hypothetical protein [Sphingomonas sp. BIUV-7]
MSSKFYRLLTADGSWQKVIDDWQRQCEEVGESIDEFAPESRALLHGFAESCEKDTWAAGLFEDSRCVAIAMLNRTMLPKTSGYTLRVRHVIVSPLLDYGALSKDAYADTLVSFTWAVVQISETTLPAEHVKFHLRSPGDMDYFRAFGNALDSKGVFARVSMHGAWLAITKSNGEGQPSESIEEGAA